MLQPLVGRLLRRRGGGRAGRGRAARSVGGRCVGRVTANDRRGLLGLVRGSAGVGNSEVGVQWGGEQHNRVAGRCKWLRNYNGRLLGHGNPRTENQFWQQ